MVLDYCKNGLPIVYDKPTNRVIYKDNKVDFSLLKRAYDSQMDRVELGNNLRMRKCDYFINFGCLRLTHEQCQSIIKKVKNATN